MEYLNYQQMSLKLASISAEKDSLLHRQPKLTNLTRLLDEERLETQRFKELVDLLQRQLAIEKCKFVHWKEQFALSRKESALTSASDEDSLNEKELIGRRDQPKDSVERVIPGISHDVLENLVRELAICKRELKKFLNGEDMKTFLENAEYEETIQQLQETIKEKDKEIDDLKVEIKEKAIDDDENEFKNQLQLKDQNARLRKALSVKTVLVSALTQELEKTEKKCSEAQERYYKEIEALREEKRSLKKHKADDGQTAEDEAALKANLIKSQQENRSLQIKLSAFQNELTIRSEDLSVKEQENLVLNIKIQEFQQRIQELEVKLQTCENCVLLSSENKELKTEADGNKELMDLMTTQMKGYEEDFKHERKDREDMKSSYDRKVEEHQGQVQVLNEELHRMKELCRKAKEQNEWLQQRYQQHGGYRSPDVVTDMPGPGLIQGGHRSYAYGQQQPWRPHTILPSEVVVDTGDAAIDNNGAGSLASHVTRECPRCEREFAPHEREEFEKHVEKCVH